MAQHLAPAPKADAPARPCATCPWLRPNFGKPHKMKWYTPANARRLWNGIRTGKTLGMMCHATDPASVEYGGDKTIDPGHERLCVGGLMLVMRSLKALEAADGIKAYRQGIGLRMTRPAMAEWVWAIATKNTPMGPALPASVANLASIGVPWEDDILNVAVGDPSVDAEDDQQGAEAEVAS